MSHLVGVNVRRNSDDAALPNSFDIHGDASRAAVLANVPFVPQADTWDCGLACCAMAASAYSAARMIPTAAPLALGDMRRRWHNQCIAYGEEDLVPSTWSVDLMALLLMPPTAPLIAAEHTRFTTTARDVGAAGQHGDMPYYHGAADADAPRLQRTIADAMRLKWPFAVRHVANRDLAADLATGRVVYICLVDSVLIRCPCQSGIMRAMVHVASAVSSCCGQCDEYCCKCCCCKNFASAPPPKEDVVCGGPLPFVGHYVLLCGYDARTRKVLYRNPARKAGGVCTMDLPELDRARRRRGTDEDLIRIELDDAHLASTAAAADVAARP